ncbi:ATP-binding cassette domain-containing protein [Streptomyces oceani]|uniref:ABC-type xenobiotic transporter n=1 Tax=Streptomyces oceani TaxID=1075402 RepID=A0A1E7KFV5_9ACTN|nr:ATP-binding cassette domain-containing protein [Streptomyces oceani]OEV02810.1 ABC transporter [Streptomyces oceani]
MTATTSTPPCEPAIQVAGLGKSFDHNTVLRSIDLTVPPGTVYALLGPNGAGKTTVVRILTTLITADTGTATVLGHDVGRDPGGVRRDIGVTGQFSAVDELLTGRENLRLMADLHHLPRERGGARAQELLERFDLVAAGDRGAQTYSGGMKRRLDLAMTLVGSPELIFLDEPTTGLDPRSRRELWNIVRELVDEGVTVFLTTQYLDEADELADRVGVLDDGGLVAEGTSTELKGRLPGGRIEVAYDDPGELAAAAGSIEEATAHEERLTLSVPHDGSLSSLRRLMGRLDDDAVTGLEVHTPDLDDVFLALTGHAARKAEPAPATPASPAPARGAHASTGNEAAR